MRGQRHVGGPTKERKKELFDLRDNVGSKVIRALADCDELREHLLHAIYGGDREKIHALKSAGRLLYYVKRDIEGALSLAETKERTMEKITVAKAMDNLPPGLRRPFFPSGKDEK